MRVLLAGIDLTTRIAAMLAASCVGLTALAYVVEISLRFTAAASLNGANDIGRYMLCCAVFLALPSVSRNQGHVAITLVPDALPPGVQRVYRTVLSLVAAAVVLLVAWFCLDIGRGQYARGVLTPMANQIPRWWLTAVVVFGLGLSAVHMILPRPLAGPGIPTHGEG